MNTTLKNLIDKQAQVRKEMQEHGEAALKEAFKAFFEENPSCRSVRWRQYTPYFNDGETCTFGVHEAYVKMNDEDNDSGDYGDGFDSYSDWAHKNGRYKEFPEAAIQAFKKASDAADELVGCEKKLFEMVFGDHVQVTATGEGFEIEEYEHD